MHKHLAELGDRVDAASIAKTLGDAAASVAHAPLTEHAKQALALLASWTHGKAGEVDEILCRLAVDTVTMVARLAKEAHEVKS